MLPWCIVSDAYVFVSRLGASQVRVASVGELSGWSAQPRATVEAEFRRQAALHLPALAALLAPVLPVADVLVAVNVHHGAVAGGHVVLELAHLGVHLRCLGFHKVWSDTNNISFNENMV